MKTSGRNGWLLLLALLALVTGAACASSGTRENQTGVLVINAPEAGQVRRVLVSEGSVVSAGTPIVEIVVERQGAEAAPAPSPGETADQRAARNIKAAEAEIETARALVVKHEAEVMRLTPLVASGQVPQAQLDAERALYEQAQRRLQQAQDRARQAQGELLTARGQQGAQANTTAQSAIPRLEAIYARTTSAGTVAVISARVGDRVTQGQPLATLRASGQ